ncbi:MAG: M48 family metalloprotease [Desulfobacteraceae bacterium]|nr:M48 family metalloprotease [Desulfobacteraceae bacterium]
MKSASASLTRRRFLQLTGASAAVWLAGCAVNPVTGEQQLMLMSESQEIDIDRQHAPLQFSTDYGVAVDDRLNGYIDRALHELAARTHRPQMPYSARAVNAVYVNAYAFPGGSIAVTRGILLAMENEAELASLLGHELGHVNARHTAQQMSRGMLTQAVVGGLAALANAQSAAAGQLASQLGMLGAGALLASYSRENEREADALGMEYMVRTGYSPAGFVGLMDVLRALSDEKPNAIELMFATHPMSEERYRTAVATADSTYAYAMNAPLNRERYMDRTAGLRAIRSTIESLQEGEKEMAGRRYPQAEALFSEALSRTPDDYAGLLLMAKCQIAQERYAEALRYANAAHQAYPSEAQAYHVRGFSYIHTNRFEAAYQDFTRYAELLPGNPATSFFRGFCLEQLQRKEDAARLYAQFLQTVRQGQQAEYAYQRLVEWGYAQ